MKLRFAAALVFSTFFTLTVFAQKIDGYVEQENVLTAAAATPQLNLLAYGPVKGKVGWQFWGITSRTWSEGLLGPTYSPTSWLTLAVGAGAETGGMRYSWSGAGKKGRLFYVTLHEWGGTTGYWHKQVVSYDLTPRLAPGFWCERAKGAGPTVSFRVYREFRPYVAVLAQNGGTTALVGATYSFAWKGRKGG